MKPENKPNRYGGGRCLNAITKSKSFSSSEKFLMVILGNFADFTGEFSDFNYHSVEKLMEHTSFSRRTIQTLSAALEEKGYIIRQKRYASDGKSLPTNYALTSRVFDEYEEMIASRVQDMQGEGASNAHPENKDNFEGGRSTCTLEGAADARGRAQQPHTISPSIISPKKFPPKKTDPPLSAKASEGDTQFSSDLQDIANDWMDWAKAIAPHLKLNYGNCLKALEKVKKHLKADDKSIETIFNFIKQDEFWSANAISPIGLMNSSNNGLKKVDNILAKLKSSSSFKTKLMNDKFKDLPPIDEIEW